MKERREKEKRVWFRRKSRQGHVDEDNDGVDEVEGKF